MSKVVLISTRRAPDWEAWSDLKSRKKTERIRITLTQSDALSIFQGVINAGSSEDARNLLQSRLSSRKHLSFWLGQVGHRQDVRLGKGRQFPEYIKTVVESIRNLERDYELFSERKEKKEMAKKDQKPVVVIRKGKSSHKADEPSETMEEMGGQAVSNNESGLAPTVLHENLQPEEAMKSTDAPPKEAPAMSRLQDNFLKSLLVFADCVVQTNASGVFDTLARNFADKPMLNYWLFRVGYGHLSDYTRNKDIVDAIRKVAYELHRDMKKNIGKAVARW